MTPSCLLIGFDGLRPDLVTPDLTPNLCRLKAEGVTFANHVTVYPSETRVVFPSLVTGTTADRHGMVGNRYLDRSAALHRMIDTADADILERIDAQTNGQLMTSPTIGEVLKEAGKSLAVLASTSRGATRCLNHKARSLNQICVSGHFVDIATPADQMTGLLKALGPLPPEPEPSAPDLEAQTLLTTAFLDHVWPKHRPDVTLLWYSEPDHSSHGCGVGAAETRQAITHADAQFGRILDWWLAEGRDDGVQLFADSDHGHITAHTRVSVRDALDGAGFRTGTAPGPDIDAVIVPGQVGAIYLTDRSDATIAKAAASLMDTDWCGPIVTRGRNTVDGVAPGTFAHGLVMAQHERAPDISFCFRSDDRIDAYGLAGGTFYDSALSEGLGVHGGLHPKELGSLAIAAGSAIKANAVSHLPSGVTDIAPTMLHLIGLSCAPTMTGRVLDEALDGAGHRTTAQQPKTEMFETGTPAFRQSLTRVRYGGSTYLTGGWRNEMPAPVAATKASAHA